MPSDRSEYLRQYRIDNAERRKAYNREYYRNNIESIREKNKTENERRKESGYYKDWLENNRERRQAWKVEFYADTQQQILTRLRAAKARCAVRETCPPVTPEEFATLPWLCAVCQDAAEQIDHIVPHKRNGCSALHNLQWKAKLMHEWLTEDEYWVWAERTHSGGCVYVEAG